MIMKSLKIVLSCCNVNENSNHPQQLVCYIYIYLLYINPVGLRKSVLPNPLGLQNDINESNRKKRMNRKTKKTIEKDKPTGAAAAGAAAAAVSSIFEKSVVRI